MSFNLELSARFPVLVRVYATEGEVIEHLARSIRAATGFVAHCTRNGYWFGELKRVEYEIYKGYRGE